MVSDFRADSALGSGGQGVYFFDLPLNALICIYTYVQSSTLAALADATRLQLVELLLRGEQPVNDLVAQVDIHQSGVSRHLRILTDSGFVQMRPNGQQRLYSLRPDRFQELDEWLSRYRQLWESRLDRLGAELARRQAKKGQR
jgi:DNA-binding transcriptional ArsR family regulator